MKQAYVQAADLVVAEKEIGFTVDLFFFVLMYAMVFLIPLLVVCGPNVTFMVTAVGTWLVTFLAQRKMRSVLRRLEGREDTENFFLLRRAIQRAELSVLVPLSMLLLAPIADLARDPLGAPAYIFVLFFVPWAAMGIPFLFVESAHLGIRRLMQPQQMEFKW